jgi:hypothetical protein
MNADEKLFKCSQCKRTCNVAEERENEEGKPICEDCYDNGSIKQELREESEPYG